MVRAMCYKPSGCGFESNWCVCDVFYGAPPHPYIEGVTRTITK